MKPVKIQIKQLFKGYLSGGKSASELMYTSDEQRFEGMVEFILKRSEEILANTTLESFTESVTTEKISEDYQFSGVRAYSTIFAIKEKAEKVKHDMKPKDIFQLGISMEKLNSELLLAGGFLLLNKNLRGPSIGGARNAQNRIDEGEENAKKVEKYWHQLIDTPEHNKITKIAEKSGLGRTTIADHLHDLGLKIKKIK